MYGYNNSKQVTENTILVLIACASILVGISLGASAGMLDEESGYEKPTFTSSLLGEPRPSLYRSDIMIERRTQFVVDGLNKPYVRGVGRPIRGLGPGCNGGCNWDASGFDRDNNGRVDKHEQHQAREAKARDEARHGNR